MMIMLKVYKALHKAFTLPIVPMLTLLLVLGSGPGCMNQGGRPLVDSRRTATITSTTGAEVEAEILYGDENTLHVLEPHGPLHIPRKSVADIDHPGALSIWGGLGLLVAGGAGLIASAACTGPDCPATGSQWILPMLGAIYLTEGLGAWYISTERAEPPSDFQH